MFDLFEVVKEISEQEFGYNTNSLGKGSLKSALQLRLAKTQLTEAEYIKFLLSNEAEKSALHQLLLISESWFLREIDPLKSALSSLRKLGTPISVLSAPCARGEEPISVLECARQVGFDYNEVTIHGYDISEKAIAKAKTFTFSSYSFRGTNDQFQYGLFDRYADELRLKPALRTHISFETGDILSESWAPNFQQYNLVLCRNLLIYLSPSIQQKLTLSLSKYLARNSYLIVGSAEAACIKQVDLQASPISPLLFEKVSHKNTASDKRNFNRAEVRRSRPQSSFNPRKTKSQKQTEKVEYKPESLQTLSIPSYDEIADLANKGQLDLAFLKALERLETEPLDSETHYILGLIAGSSGKLDEASYWIQKTLELEPNHEDAITYMSSISSRRA